MPQSRPRRGGWRKRLDSGWDRARRVYSMRVLEEDNILELSFADGSEIGLQVEASLLPESGLRCIVLTGELTEKMKKELKGRLIEMPISMTDCWIVGACTFNPSRREGSDYPQFGYLVKGRHLRLRFMGREGRWAEVVPSAILEEINLD